MTGLSFLVPTPSTSYSLVGKVQDRQKIPSEAAQSVGGGPFRRTGRDASEPSAREAVRMKPHETA